ncbi:hypothetical protein [Metapseudomonas boanensis]|uniref:Uncharacterized protein n=1 Tax=Metapseudomonas boanensis TaxID=2822138 RepID=A0ABS5XF55_9GAMM|nr:hypothetical protein [Pseudomonas boanensis]MBT8766294.1 hypothetical protein [Pseudomonas boanensis]
MNDDKNYLEKIAGLEEGASSVIQLSQETPLEHFFDVVERLDTRVLDNSGVIRDGLLGQLGCIDLAIYRHPDVADDLKLGFKILLLALIEANVIALGEDKDAQVKKAVQEQTSASARKAAHARHHHTNQQKAAALAAWDAYGENVSSVAAFARSRHKDYGVTQRTLCSWISDHCKATEKTTD